MGIIMTRHDEECFYMNLLISPLSSLPAWPTSLPYCVPSDLVMSICAVWRVYNQLLPMVLVNETAKKFTTAITEHYPIKYFEHPTEITLYIRWLRAKNIGWKFMGVRPGMADLTLLLQVAVIGYASLAAQLISDLIDEERLTE